MSELSILLPTYNGSRFLQEQISSIQGQSFRDWRLLICDDGSTDTTIKIIECFAAKDSRIVLFPSTGNVGQRDRLRTLVSKTRTRLIALADQDDIWEASKIDLLIDNIDRHELCFGSSWLIGEDGDEFGRQLGDTLPPPYRMSDRLTWLFRPLVSAHALVGTRRLFHETVFSRTLPFDWLMSVEAAFNDDLCYVPAARTYHRLHGQNQHNAALMNDLVPPRLFDRSILLNLPRAVWHGRMHFLSMLEHLSFSPLLNSDTQHRAKSAYALCFKAWYKYHGLLTYRQVSQSLREQIELVLRPLAGSHEDWQYFSLRFDAIALPLYGLARVSARKRRLAIEWPSQ